MALINSTGHEILDETPIAIPVQIHRRSTIADVKNQWKLAQMLAEQEGAESPEEAEDFDISDDPIDYTIPFEHAAKHLDEDAFLEYLGEAKNHLADLERQAALQKTPLETGTGNQPTPLSEGQPQPPIPTP